MTLEELAGEVVGSGAATWWHTRAIGLQAEPGELAGAASGAQLVRDFLIRLHFGVYT
jgi:uncharacterized protein (DUF2384 family)